jgi:hypothetical protein
MPEIMDFFIGNSVLDCEPGQRVRFANQREFFDIKVR